MIPYKTDIKLDENWQFSPHANGDMLLVTDLECVLQDIRLEALTQEGELFYDPEYGWSLLDFMQQQVSEITNLELEQRVITKLTRRGDIDLKSIQINADFNQDNITVYISWRFISNDELYHLNLSIGRVSIEVIVID